MVGVAYKDLTVHHTAHDLPAAVASELGKISSVRDWLKNFYSSFEKVDSHAHKYYGLWDDLGLETTIRVDNIQTATQTICKAYDDVKDSACALVAHADKLHLYWQGQAADKITHLVAEDARTKHNIHSQTIAAITSELNQVPDRIFDAVHKKTSTILGVSGGGVPPLYSAGSHNCQEIQSGIVNDTNDGMSRDTYNSLPVHDVLALCIAYKYLSNHSVKFEEKRTKEVHNTDKKGHTHTHISHYTAEKHVGQLAPELRNAYLVLHPQAKDADPIDHHFPCEIHHFVEGESCNGGFKGFYNSVANTCIEANDTSINDIAKIYDHLVQITDPRQVPVPKPLTPEHVCDCSEHGGAKNTDKKDADHKDTSLYVDKNGKLVPAGPKNADSVKGLVLINSKDILPNGDVVVNGKTIPANLLVDVNGKKYLPSSLIVDTNGNNPGGVGPNGSGGSAGNGGNGGNGGSSGGYVDGAGITNGVAGIVSGIAGGIASGIGSVASGVASVAKPISDGVIGLTGNVGDDSEESIDDDAEYDRDHSGSHSGYHVTAAEDNQHIEVRGPDGKITRFIVRDGKLVPEAADDAAATTATATGDDQGVVVDPHSGITGNSIGTRVDSDGSVDTIDADTTSDGSDDFDVHDPIIE